MVACSLGVLREEQVTSRCYARVGCGEIEACMKENSMRIDLPIGNPLKVAE